MALRKTPLLKYLLIFFHIFLFLFISIFTVPVNKHVFLMLGALFYCSFLSCYQVSNPPLTSSAYYPDLSYHREWEALATEISGPLHYSQTYMKLVKTRCNREGKLFVSVVVFCLFNLCLFNLLICLIVGEVLWRKEQGPIISEHPRGRLLRNACAFSLIVFKRKQM